MSNVFIRTAVRTLFAVTTRQRALAQCETVLAKYLMLADTVSPEAGTRCVRVPPLRGIDEDMRDWSFFMILEHNAIVNRSMTAMVCQLVRGEPLSGPATIDPKTGVMPSAAPGPEQVKRFADSVHEHIEAVKGLDTLRRTATSQHPVFGTFDAHKWNCMFPFHLSLHYAQAEKVLAVK